MHESTESLTPSTSELFAEYVMPTYGRFDFRVARGSGCRVWDEEGKEYLDFGAGIAVCSIGHSHPRMTEALNRQSQILVHTSNLYYTRPQGLLARKLVELTGAPGKIFFCNSGAEANEALFKLARKFGNETLPPPPKHTVGEWVEAEQSRFEVITFDGSFHGRTLAAIAATGQQKVKNGFEPAVAGFSHVPFNDAPALLAAITPRTAAILVEPIQGESGIWPADAHFLRTLRSICDDHGLLLLFDEIQCGLGRTGGWCGWKTLAGNDLLPDAVSWAKGIAGGFPMGAIWVSDRSVSLKKGGAIPLSTLLGPGSHGTTFGGTPLACAVASEVLSVIEEENLLSNARELGAYAVRELKAIGSPHIQEIRGVGLLIGIELSAATTLPEAGSRPLALAFVARLQAAGLLSVPSGARALRWLPPLNVTRAEIDEAVEILRGVLSSI